MIVYIHVPFCRTCCRYCAFHSTAIGRWIDPADSPLVRDYVDTLLLELAHWGDCYVGMEVQTVFWGGGTPSLLPPRIVGIVLERMARYFTLSSRAEITLEANPESLRDRDKAGQYLAAGVNRLSIGIQTLDETMLRMLGRAHMGRDSLHATFVAREAGFANISLDLMWGLPGQSVRQWLQTLKDVVHMGPNHISAYGLTLEHGTDLERACEEGQVVLPLERDQNVMFMEGAAFLESSGYMQYEISNFARTDFQCRHNLGYWEGLDYLGLGPSATSTMAGRRWTNPPDPQVWENKIRAACLDDNAELLTHATRTLEMLMLRLRTARGLCLKDWLDTTGHDFLDDNKKFVQAMHENGLIRIRHGYLSLTRNGMLVSNAILSNLFEQAEKALNPGKNTPELVEAVS
ncbi:MAG: radical SAM family heme chaperone HemW [Desulfovibrio sp.]|nr:radical SAM family heme chaperone HemW [Desulfovibrio sp.]